MDRGDEDGEFGELNEQTRTIWDANAGFWDDRIGGGNAFQCELIEPSTERLLAVRSGESVLDIACGSGRFARRLADLGARVVAFDFSERFIERARQRSGGNAGNVVYHVIDATDADAILALGVERFHAAVASMALMDLARIGPLMGALRRSLKPGGRFVFSVIHPCFQPGRTCKFAESVEGDDGRAGTVRGVKVTRYITPVATKGEGILGQPQPHYYFHRPLGVLFGAGFREGFVIDGLEEPTFKNEPAEKGSLRWRDLSEIPPVLVVRMRLMRDSEEK